MICQSSHRRSLGRYTELIGEDLLLWSDLIICANLLDLTREWKILASGCAPRACVLHEATWSPHSLCLLQITEEQVGGLGAQKQQMQPRSLMYLFVLRDYSAWVESARFQATFASTRKGSKYTRFYSNRLKIEGAHSITTYSQKYTCSKSSRKFYAIYSSLL